MADQVQTSREILVTIKEKQDRMGADIAEIKANVKSIENCQDSFEKMYAQRHAELQALANNTKARVDGLEIITKENELMQRQRAETYEKRFTTMEKVLERQAVMNSVIIFLGTIISSAVVMYFWNTFIAN